jgi:NADH-quinone oxidoreductase subunit H
MMDWFAQHLGTILAIALPVVMPLVLFQILPLIVLLERRGAAFIQDRSGPHRAGVNLQLRSLTGIFAERQEGTVLRLRAFGMLYNLTDLVKGLTKEQFIPPFAFRGWYMVAPVIPVLIGLLTPAVIPWFGPIAWNGEVISSTILPTDNGLLLLFALSSLSVYGVVLGSWSSNSKYALLGGVRASAMMISYEVSMGLAILGVLLIVGSFSLTDVVAWQMAHTWGIVVQPVGFLLFLTALFAETCRNPFDVTEGESEIVGGYHTEYNGIRFMLFMTGEYLHILVAGFVIAALFLGGYQLAPVPGWDSDWLRMHLGKIVLGLCAVTGLLLLWAVRALIRHRSHQAAGTGSDRAMRMREYGFYAAAVAGLALGTLALGGLAAATLWHNVPTITANGLREFSGIVTGVAALVEFHILAGKALLVCWLFVWVRWTLPRFRYDQIMSLGWKVLLNIALVNLVVTAIVAKLVRG